MFHHNLSYLLVSLLCPGALLSVNYFMIIVFNKAQALKESKKYYKLLVLHNENTMKISWKFECKNSGWDKNNVL